jgi:hypothetical protein
VVADGTRRRFGALWLVVIVAGAAGCATDPDIVATMRSNGADGVLHVPKDMPTCEAGRYSGIMIAEPGDGVASISFSGTFEFALVEALGGEFLVLQNDAKLSGSGADGTKFRADIQGGGGCTEGTTFETELINGTYEIPGVAMIPFEGSIVGAYSEYHSFSGHWTTNLHPPLSADPLIVAGTWSAIFLGPN